MTDFTIRRANYDDLPILEQLMYRLHDEHHHAEPEHFKAPEQILEEKKIVEYINAPDALLYVAVDNSVLVGFVTAHFGELSSTVSKPVMMGTIDELYVVTEQRCNGIGKRLLQRCIDEFDDYGVKQVFVEVWEFNQSAISLYQHIGFKHHIHCLRKGL